MSRPTQTVELTGKRWKLHQALGGAAILLGCLLIWLASGWVAILGLVLFLVGLYAYAVGRLGAWWYNG